ncbi:DnaJ C-terminal domain-containing protein [Variovorax sp. OV329]|uniref:DnaJ C-terminal domain-containing protein n=1 Tax=Variovorax sp. OV329 TaxID=1882825 RepID=UPI0020C87D2F|nr:DnaJ C-terminal domain-containing protein [Variovorax sp. OV329]
MDTDNAFAELGLAPDATEREVKAAWRRLASQWHPDRNESAGAVARMQRINQAFEEIRRAGFADRASSDADAPADTPEGNTPDKSNADQGTAASGASGTQRRGRTLHRKVRLTLEQAASGCIKVLRGKLTDNCASCHGAGHQVLGGNCARCGGSGAIPKRSFFGWPTGVAECEACLGGGIARQACAACAGVGKMAPRDYKINVRIPPGVRNGDLLHVDGRRVSAEGPPADVEIRIEVSSHAFFELDDDGTIRCEMPIDGFAWIANRQIKVPTVTGFQALQLSRDRLSYRLKGMGFPVQCRGPSADHLVTLVPIFPQQLSTDQQILLDQLSATTLGAGEEALDDRLRAWNRGLRGWKGGNGS